MNKNKFRFILSAIMVLGFLIVANKAFAAPYDFETLVPANNGLAFTSPIGLTKDSGGNIYVTDIDVVKKFSSAGVLIAQWGGTGTGNGEFSAPSSMDSDASDNIYVADSDNNRVQVFTSTGGYLFQWGTSGTGNGEFDSPVDILIHSSGKIYVTDWGNNRVQIFTSTGGYFSQFGKFRNPWGIVEDSTGKVYVSDYMNTRIQHFQADGTLFNQWIINVNPSGIAVDSADNVYIADNNNDRVQQFDPTGVYISEWGNPRGVTDGKLIDPRGIIIDDLDKVYVAEMMNSRVQKFDTSGTFIEKWGTIGVTDGKYSHPQGVAVDASGNIYVADRGNSRVQKFASNGTFIKHLDGVTAVPNPWGFPSSTFSVTHMAVDSLGNIYTVDTWNDRVLKFNSNGTFTNEWGIAGIGEGEFGSPWGIAVNSSDEVYVSDTYNSRIQKFDSNGTFILEFGTGGAAPKSLSVAAIRPLLGGAPDGEFNRPRGIGIDSSNNIYVADSGNNRIQKFSSNGAFISKFCVGAVGGLSIKPSAVAADGECSSPYDVAIDSLDNVYVADRNNHRVQVFDTDGVYVNKFGVYGSENGNFYMPNSIAIDSADDVYIVDDSRVQKFEGLGTGSSESSPSLEVEEQGEVKVIGGSRGFVNPSNGEDMEIDFKPTAPGKVTVRIYTLKGRLLWKQSKTVSDTDTSHITWACQNSRGNVVASGLYIVHVKGPGLDIKKKVAILR